MICCVSNCPEPLQPRGNLAHPDLLPPRCCLMSACGSSCPGMMGIPIMSLVRWEGKEGEMLSSPRSPIDKGPPEVAVTWKMTAWGRLSDTEEWLSVWPLTSLLWSVSILGGCVSAMNCKTIMRHSIMLKASVYWHFSTGTTMHNDELSWHSGLL